MKEFILTIEIRKPSYAQNKTVRDSINRSLWDAVRNQVYENSGFACDICGNQDKEKLHAHEVWSFDEERFLLILEDVQSLCKNCHDLKHVQHAVLRLEDRERRELVMKKLKKHFMNVNDCTAKDFERHYLNKLERSEEYPVARTSEDLVEIGERRAREAFLNAQKWRFIISETIPFAKEIEADLDAKGLLFN